MDVLQAQSWTHLRKADLRNFSLTQAAAALKPSKFKLSQGLFPNFNNSNFVLFAFYLGENKLNTHGISELMKADWPELISLNLCNCRNLLRRQYDLKLRNHSLN